MCSSSSGKFFKTGAGGDLFDGSVGLADRSTGHFPRQDRFSKVPNYLTGTVLMLRPLIIEIPQGRRVSENIAEIAGTHHTCSVALIKRGLRAQLQTKVSSSGSCSQLDLYPDLPLKEDIVDQATYMVEIPLFPRLCKR